MTLEQRVPHGHPLREIRRITEVVLKSLSQEFDSLYSAFGRPSIPPEYGLRALLLQAFYSIRSERQMVEQIEFNLLLSLVRPTPGTQAFPGTRRFEPLCYLLLVTPSHIPSTHRGYPRHEDIRACLKWTYAQDLRPYMRSCLQRSLHIECTEAKAAAGLNL